MKETLNRLIELQRTDDAVVETTRQLSELEQGLTGAKSALDASQAAVDAAHLATQEARAETHRLELELDEGEGQIRKFEGALNGAKSNKEYQEILLSVATVKAQNGKLEEKILESMEVIEQRESVEADKKTEHAACEADLRAAEAKLEEARQSLEAELAQTRAARDTLAGDVEPEKLKLYERIRGGNTRSGSAVVAVHGEYCQGCQMAITPQDMADLMQGARIVLCRTCQRILVYEE